jgi:hypothetical protein
MQVVFRDMMEGHATIGREGINVTKCFFGLVYVYSGLTAKSVRMSF